jgi:hypothetical protein
LLGPGDIDAYDAGMGMGTPQDLRMEHAWELAVQVCGKWSPPQDLVEGVHPKNAFPYHNNYPHKSRATPASPNCSNVFLHGFPLFGSQPMSLEYSSTIPLR